MAKPRRLMAHIVARQGFDDDTWRSFIGQIKRAMRRFGVETLEAAWREVVPGETEDSPAAISITPFAVQAPPERGEN